MATIHMKGFGATLCAKMAETTASTTDNTKVTCARCLKELGKMPSVPNFLAALEKAEIEAARMKKIAACEATLRYATEEEDAMLHSIGRDLQRTMEARAKFAAAILEGGFEHTISWSGDKVRDEYEALTVGTIWHDMFLCQHSDKPEVQAKTLRQIVEHRLARVTDDLLRNAFRPCSTSPMSNACEVAKAEGARAAYEELKNYARSYERQDEARAQALAQLVGIVR